MVCAMFFFFFLLRANVARARHRMIALAMGASDEGEVGCAAWGQE